MFLLNNDTKLYTTLKSGDSVAIGLGSPSPSSTTGANAQLWHNGTAKFGYDKDKEKYNVVIDSSGKVEMGFITANNKNKYAMTIATDGTISGLDWSISNSGDATFDNLAINKKTTIKGKTYLYDNLYLYGNISLGDSGSISGGNTILTFTEDYGGLLVDGRLEVTSSSSFKNYTSFSKRITCHGGILLGEEQTLEFSRGTLGTVPINVDSAWALYDGRKCTGTYKLLLSGGLPTDYVTFTFTDGVLTNIVE